MNNLKILQMLTLKTKINAIFKKDNSNNHQDINSYPILGLVLTEDPEGNREIKPMYLGAKGLIEILDRNSSSFVELRTASEGLYIHELNNFL